jgi:hypothetical protein
MSRTLTHNRGLADGRSFQSATLPFHRCRDGYALDRVPGSDATGQPPEHGWLSGVFLPAAGVTAGYIS